MTRLAACLVGVALASAGLLEAEDSSRFTFGVQASVAVSTRDNGSFDYADYDHSVLRLARLTVDGGVRLGPRLSLLTEVRADNSGLMVSALYLRVHPWLSHAIDVQAGRIPPVFGAFARRSYETENPLIGYPLVYQYLTSLRPDSVPYNADALLQARGSGWSIGYGYSNPSHGVPLVSASRWDTGIEARIGQEPLSIAASVTQGTLSNPLVRDDNGGKQVATRGECRPAMGLILGVSAARGEFLSRSVTSRLLPGGTYDQSALGVDGEYSHGYWVFRGEGVFSAWDLPLLGRPFVSTPVKALGGFLESRYKIRPGLYAAARADRISFNEVEGSASSYPSAPWEAPVSRIEVGGGYSVRRNLVLKAAYQHNWRDYQGPFRSTSIVAAQVLFWY